MNLRRLKYFVKIVDIGSLTQAAEVLHIAQPALSQQVATLEGEMDQQLLIRTKRGVTANGSRKNSLYPCPHYSAPVRTGATGGQQRRPDPQRARFHWSCAGHCGVFYHHAAAAGRSC